MIDYGGWNVGNGVGLLTLVAVNTENRKFLSFKAWKVLEDRTHGTDIGRLQRHYTYWRVPEPAIAPSVGMAAQILSCSLTPGKITSRRTNGAIQVGSLADFSLEHP